MQWLSCTITVYLWLSPLETSCKTLVTIHPDIIGRYSLHLPLLFVTLWRYLPVHRIKLVHCNFAVEYESEGFVRVCYVLGNFGFINKMPWLLIKGKLVCNSSNRSPFRCLHGPSGGSRHEVIFLFGFFNVRKTERIQLAQLMTKFETDFMIFRRLLLLVPPISMMKRQTSPTGETVLTSLLLVLISLLPHIPAFPDLLCWMALPWQPLLLPVCNKSLTHVYIRLLRWNKKSCKDGYFWTVKKVLRIICCVFLAWDLEIWLP